MRLSPGRFLAGRALSSWMAMSLLGAALLTALALGLVIERFVRRHELQQAGVALAQVGWQLRDQLDRGLAERHAEIIALSGSALLRALDDPRLMRDALQTLQRKAPLCAWIGVVDRQGRVLASTGGLLEGADVSARPWFKAALEGPFAGDLHAAVLLEKLLPRQAEPWRFVDLAAPVVADGATKAVIGAHLSWEWARDIERQLLAPVLRDQGIQTFIVRRDGEVLLGPQGTVGTKLDLQALRAAVGDSGAGRVVAWPGEGEHVTAVVATQGQGSYPGLGWSVVVRQPRAVALQSYAELQAQLALATGAVALFMALLVPLAGRHLAAPLTQITEALRQPGSATLPALRGLSYREAQWLLGALNGMRERLQGQAEELRAANAGLEQRVAERTAELQRSRGMLQTVADGVPALVALVDGGLCHRFVNEAYRQWWGVDPQSLVGRPLAALWDAVTLERLQPALQRALAGERASVEHALRMGGRERFVESTCLPQDEGGGAGAGCLLVVYDVTARKQLELQLAREAHFDALTGLPNRRHLMEQLTRAMLRTQRQGQPLALLFLDLDGFKGVNDRHGHDAGDRLLQAVAQRLQCSVRRTDTVARLAGDEFVVLLEGLSSAEDAAPVIDTIRDVLTQPVELPGGVTVQVGASVGSAIYAGEPDVGAEQLLSRSDAAMYEAKRGRLRAREAAAVPRTA